MNSERPVRLIYAETLERRRLSVFFRLLLAIPHFIWLGLWSLVVVPVALVGWVATLATGSLPVRLHAFLSAYVRYTTHVTAYVSLVAERYPDFGGAVGSYPIDVEIAGPVRQDRRKTAFRLILAFPAMLVAGALISGSNFGVNSYVSLSVGLGGTAAFLGWFVCLARGRMPVGFNRLLAYGLGYQAQASAYLLLLTDSYPNADPRLVALPADVPPSPLRIVNADDGARSRLTTFFRLLLAIPLILWLYLWAIAALLVGVVNWFVCLLRGRSTPGLHAFLSAYVRFAAHVGAYLTLAAAPYPGFTGRAGSYPVDVEIGELVTQNRWKTAFRAVLVLPAILLGFGFGLALAVSAVLCWFAAMVTGRVPEGLQRLSVYAIGYGAQTRAYMALLSDVYPYSGP